MLGNGFFPVSVLVSLSSCVNEKTKDWEGAGVVLEIGIREQIRVEVFLC